jgi:hypothetical protein
MAKAEREPSTDDEIWFNDAVKLGADVTGDAVTAERLLIGELKRGQVPYSYLDAFNRVRGKSAFWNAPFLTVVRTANRAFIGAPIDGINASADVPASMDGIKVDRATVEALFGITPAKSKPLAAVFEEPKGWQAKRALRAMRELYPPDGKAPSHAKLNELEQQIAGKLDELEPGSGKRAPSPEVVKVVVDFLDRRDD